MMTKTRLRVWTAVMVITLSACASAPRENAHLERARMLYNEAVVDVAVATHASDALDRAREALDLADSRWQKKDDQWLVEHHAYIASQRVRTARLIAEARQAEFDMAKMSEERQNLTLRVREAELERVRQEAQALKRQMAALQAEETERGMVLTLGDVLFEVDQATLAPAAARNIARIVAFMRNYPNRRAVIEGHTDSMGEADYNLQLSRDRAIAVRDSLVNAGISASRLSTQGFGETLPVADNTEAAGRQANRRVEIIFPNEGAQISEYEE